MEYREPLVIEPAIPARNTVIWLHGLGADGGDFLPLVEELQLSEPKALRYVFPHAPVLPVTVNAGYEMPAWYDIYAMDLLAEVDTQGIDRSVDYLLQLVDREIGQGIAGEHILLAGFSQGGVIALAAAMRSVQPLAGVMALSTYLPAVIPISPRPRRNIFMAHGRMDNVVPWQAAEDARQRLQQAGHDMTWREYDMAHSLCAEEVADMREWMARCLR